MYYIQTSFKNNKKKSLTKWVILHKEKTYPYRFHIKKSDCAAGAFFADCFCRKCARSVFQSMAFSILFAFAGGNPLCFGKPFLFVFFLALLLMLLNFFVVSSSVPVLFSGGSLPKTAPLSFCLSAADFVAAGYFRNGGRSSGCRVGRG